MPTWMSRWPSPHLWQTNIDKLSDEVIVDEASSYQAFAEHLLPESLPPVWPCPGDVAGIASRWYNNSNRCPRAAPSLRPMADEKVLESCCAPLTGAQYLRASQPFGEPRVHHHTAAAAQQTGRLAAQFHVGSRKLYNALVILAHCMDVIAPQHHWRSPEIFI